MKRSPTADWNGLASGGILAEKKQSPHVPSQYYGYSLQCTHCVYLLFKGKPGSKISVEVLEDVAAEDPSGEVMAVQLKSASKTNPIANRSVHLWKTFANWIRAVESSELNVEKTTFELRLGQKRNGSICESFNTAKTEETASRAIERARNKFFTKKGELRKGTGESLGEVAKNVFTPERAKILQSIVRHFQLSFGTQYAYEELLEHVKAVWISRDIAEDVLLRALGWVKKELDNAIERGKPPFVDYNEFRTEIEAFQKRLDGRNYIPSFAGQPSPEQIELQKPSVFVQQLNLIKYDEAKILSAITDFLSANANRVEYAKRGLVHIESFQDFEGALSSLWQNHRDEVELNQDEEETNRGRRLVSRCLRESPRLQGIDVPADFVRGCFHYLADQPIIGWHPRYKMLLKSMGVSDGQP